MHKMFPRVHHMEVMLCRTPPTAVREISYHIIKATNHRIFRMMSIQRRIKEHCKNIWKTEVQAYMSGQGMRQLQNFVYFLGKIALQNIYWLFLRPYCTLCDQQEEMDRTICWDALLSLQHLKAKDTGRQEVKWVKDTVNIHALSIYK